MPLIDKDIILDQDYEKIERASFDDIVQFIVKDCNEAIAEPNLPFRTKFATEQGRMTKAVAHFIKASALLFDANPIHSSSLSLYLRQPNNVRRKSFRNMLHNRSPISIYTKNGFNT